MKPRPLCPTTAISAPSCSPSRKAQPAVVSIPSVPPVVSTWPSAFARLIHPSVCESPMTSTFLAFAIGAGALLELVAVTL